MTILLEQTLFIAKGIFTTLELLVGGLLIGVMFSLPISILRHKNMGAYVINPIISLIRGTPLILQLALIYFSIPQITGIKLNIITAGVIAFGLNSFAYMSEILRGGISSIPKGQFEVGQSLQIPTFYLWKDIIFPQVFRNTFPSMINEIISLLKETALIATIGGMDIMRSAQLVAAESFTYLLPLSIAALYYYLMVVIIESVGRQLSRRFVC